MNVSKKAKRLATVLMSAICMLSLILGTGCTNTPAIEDYPEAITQNPKPDDNTDVKKPDESNDADANIDAVFLDDFDSLKESGEFVYNPTTLHPVFKHEVESNPKIAKIAKKILESVYNVEEEITFSDELECNNSEFNQALILAQFSSPMVSAAIIDFKEDNTYTITYFPTYQFINDESYMVEIADSLSPEDAKIRFDEYEKIITEGINNNLSSKDDSIERAAKIYKYIIRTIIKQ